MDSKIIATMELQQMRFHAYHGCLDIEKEQGGEYLVDCSYCLDILDAAQSDDLYDAVDYSKIYEVIAREMEKPSNLLEHLAPRIAQAVKDEFPQIESVTISVAKLNPPMDADISATRITVTL